MTPEAKAREKIDSKLMKSGWIIQDMYQMNPIASLGVAITVAERYSLKSGFRL